MLISGDGGRVVGRWNDMYLIGGFLLGGSNVENWRGGDHQKKNLFINSVEFSMYDRPIETVKYIWVNFLHMFHWKFITKLQKSTSFAYSWSNSKEYKILDAIVPNEMLVVNGNTGSYEIDEYSLVVICLNSFQHYNSVAFSLFIYAA